MRSAEPRAPEPTNRGHDWRLDAAGSRRRRIAAWGRPRSDPLGRLLTALAVVWAVLVVAAPWLATVPAVGGDYLSASAYAFGALVCHQRPERSFHLAGAQLPVCARCTGLYLSAALGILFVWARRPSPAAPVRAVAGLPPVGRAADGGHAGVRMVAPV